jgi:hypothetical protein
MVTWTAAATGDLRIATYARVTLKKNARVKMLSNLLLFWKKEHNGFLFLPLF